MSKAAPTPKNNMGKPEPRLDARLKVTGEALYPSDFSLSNHAFAVLLTSRIAKGRITGIDLEAAQKVPGVLDILTYETTRELHKIPYSGGGSGASTSLQQLGPEIHHAGQIVALVTAETLEAAQEASFLIDIAYSAEVPTAGLDSAGTTLTDAGKDSQPPKEMPKKGDVEAALGSADVTIDVKYATPTQHHNPIELFTTTCEWSNGHLRIYEPSQFVYGLKNSLAVAFAIDPENVHVVSPYVGGAFGSKSQATPRTALVALAAKRLNRSVKLVATRAQGFTIATYRAETQHHIRMGATRDGKLVGYSHHGSELSSRPDDYCVAGVEDSSHLYGFGTVETDVKIVHADRNTPGFMRSPPVIPYIYALECAMDEMAVKLDMDPIEFRRINDTNVDPVSGKEFSSRSLMQCYEEAAEAFGWKHRGSKVGSMRKGDWLIGYGCASAVYPTHMGPSTARIRLFPNGNIEVQTAAHELGTGAYTVIGQTAAERLGTDFSKVEVRLGDSDLPPAIVAGGSSTTASVCSAVIIGCDAIRAKLIRAAVTANDGPLSGADADKLVFAGGFVKSPSGAKEKIESLFAKLGVGALEEYAEFVPKGLKPDAVAKLYGGQAKLIGGPAGEKLMYAMGAEFVEVHIHARTKEIRVPRAVGAFAAGRLMNTRTAHSQLMGGIIWGISSALHEATEIDLKRARYVNDNLADYLVPVNADVGTVDVILVSEQDDYVNPAGAKGLGELGNVGTAAAIANAVYHATGKRLRQLPIRLEDLLTA
jgi:xanthine dehydrogenase YagR molybdenum-binding subunit